jgi:hypothetical protein
MFPTVQAPARSRYIETERERDRRYSEHHTLYSRVLEKWKSLKISSFFSIKNLLILHECEELKRKLVTAAWDRKRSHKSV